MTTHGILVVSAQQVCQPTFFFCTQEDIEPNPSRRRNQTEWGYGCGCMQIQFQIWDHTMHPHPMEAWMWVK